MAKTSRRKRPIDRGPTKSLSAKLIVIATEGTVTEEDYFKMLRNSKIHLKIIGTPREGGKVVETIIKALRVEGRYP